VPLSLDYNSTELDVLHSPIVAPISLSPNVSQFKVHLTGQEAGETVLIVTARMLANEELR